MTLASDELYGSELIGARIQAVRDQICDGAPIVHGFPARRRWPILRFGALIIWQLVLACVGGLLIGLSGMSASNPLLFGLAMSPVIMLAQLTASGTRQTIGLAADGSVVVARHSLLFGARCIGIEAVHKASAALTIESTPPWWRKPKVMLDGQAWYLLDSRDVDLSTFEQRLTDRKAPDRNLTPAPS